jgi:hypothetical protein
MSTAAPVVDVDEDQLTRGKISLEQDHPSPLDGDNGGGTGGEPPPLPPPTARRDKPDRPPRWQRILIWSVCTLIAMLLAGFLGWRIGGAAGRLAQSLERALTPEA